MKDNYNLFVNAEYAENGISVSIENRNSFRVSNIDMTVIYNENVVTTHIGGIEHDSVWHSGDVADEDGAFNSVGYYEGQEMCITPALYDRDKGIYHGEPHHALVWQDCTPNDEKIRIFNYAFPQKGITVRLQFLAEGPRVMFAGHSFTGLWDSAYYYFRELAKMGGWNAQIAYSYWGGTGISHYAGLVEGCEERSAQCDKVFAANERYDFCVFAGNSDEAVSTYSRKVGATDYSMRDSMLNGAKILSGKTADKHARMILWVTHAYRYGFFYDMGVKPWHKGKQGDPYYSENASYILTLTNKQMTEANMDWYTKLADQAGALLAPVAAVYRYILENNISEADPYIVPGEECGDNGHQNNLGNYIAACVLYKLIFRESPVGLGIPLSHSFGTAGGGITQRQAELIQNAVDKIV